jgi:hypothetical protein
MNSAAALLSSFFLAGSLALNGSLVQAEGRILRDDFPNSNCCPRKFPVVHMHPLEDEGSAGILDLHRPCDYDPVHCCPYFCDDAGEKDRPVPMREIFDGPLAHN